MLFIESWICFDKSLDVAFDRICYLKMLSLKVVNRISSSYHHQLNVHLLPR